MNLPSLETKVMGVHPERALQGPPAGPPGLLLLLQRLIACNSVSVHRKPRQDTGNDSSRQEGGRQNFTPERSGGKEPLGRDTACRTGEPSQPEALSQLCSASPLGSAALAAPEHWPVRVGPHSPLPLRGQGAHSARTQPRLLPTRLGQSH